MMLTVMRSTSLKAHKSPPTSPRRKKIVRFADSLGLDLEAVKTILQDDLPFIPDSAFSNLDVPEDFLPSKKSDSTQTLVNGSGNVKAFASPYSYPAPPPFVPFRATNGINGHRRVFTNGLSDSLDRLHLDSDEDDLLDDHCGVAVDCLKKPFHSSNQMIGIPPWNVSISSSLSSSNLNNNNGIKPSLNKKQVEDSKKILQSQRRQESMAKSMPPWLSLYQSTRSATLIPEFVEPFVQVNFLDRVRAQSICLENCYISNTASSPLTSPTGTKNPCSVSINSTSPTGCSANNLTNASDGCAVSVTACIRVVNLSFEKEIYCRFSTNNWATWTEVLATFIPTSSDSWTDRFTSTFTVGNLTAGQRVSFALRYKSGGQEYWDNNNGQNYSLMYRI